LTRRQQCHEKNPLADSAQPSTRDAAESQYEIEIEIEAFDEPAKGGTAVERGNGHRSERDERGNGDVTSVEVESEKATQEQTECVRSVPDASLTAERHTNEDAETPSLSEDQEAIGGRSAEGFSDATSPKSEIDEASIAADQKIIKNQGDHGEGANFQNDTNYKDSSPSGTTTEKATESTTTESSRQDSSTVFEQVQRDASEKHEP
jgi:hypothetical protein